MTLLRLLAATLAVVSVLAHAQAPSRAALHLVFVVDGLRPDSITPADTPTLHRLRAEGASFENSHSVFPTVTRVNATSLSTGMQPGRHGILGNQIYIPAVVPDRAFVNSDFRPLLRLGELTNGGIALVPSMAEHAAEVGRKYVAVSSGSTGSALLLAPRAPFGSGVVINGEFFDSRSAGWPQAVSDEVLRRFGTQPKKGGAAESHDPQVDWAMRVLREYVLPEMKPDVVYNWITEPDHVQHYYGAGALQALASIRNADRNIGDVLETLGRLGLRERTNIVVVSDHGFGHTAHAVNVGQELLDGGFRREDFVLASSGQSVGVHVRDRDAAKIRAIAEFLQRQPWIGVVLTAHAGGAAHEGGVPGTFALEFAHLGGGERSPDLVFTFPWTSNLNPHGVPGTDTVMTPGGKTGPVSGVRADHGSMSPWTVKNTMFAWGPDFKRGVRVRVPSSNADVTPTVLYLLGHPKAGSLDGRVLREAMVDGPDVEQVAVETRTLRVANGAYRAALQVSEAGGRRYLDKSWREAP